MGSNIFAQGYAADQHRCAMTWSGGVAQHTHTSTPKWLPYLSMDTSWVKVGPLPAKWGVEPVSNGWEGWLNTPGEISFSIDSYPTPLQRLATYFFNWEFENNQQLERKSSELHISWHLQPKFPQHALHTLICHAKHLWILPEHHSRTDFQSMFISIQLNPAISNRAQETIYHRWRCTPCSQWLGMVSLERLTGLNQGNRENNDKNGLCTNDKKHASNPFKTITNSQPWSWP